MPAPVDRAEDSPPAPLRICLAAHAYSPESGGLGVLIDELAKELVRRGHSVSILALSTVGSLRCSASVRADGVSVRRWRRAIGGRRFQYSPGLARWFRAHESQFDVVHAFNYHASVALSISLGTSTPLVLTPLYHGVGHTLLARIAHGPYRKIARHLWRRSSAIVACSAGEANALRRDFGHLIGDLSVIPLAVESKQGGVPEPESGPIRPIVLFAGRLDRHKHVDVAIHAMQELTEPADLIVCGSGPELSNLRQLCHRLGVEDRVQLRGFVSAEVLADLQRSARVIVSLSTNESFGLSVAEGVASGAVAVVTDIPAHREVIEFADAPAEYVSSPAKAADVTLALSRALSRERVTRVLSLDRKWSTVALEYEQVYRRAMSSPSPG